MTRNSAVLFRNILLIFVALNLHEIVLSTAEECACKVPNRPDVSSKAETARWMVHYLDWGVLSTISTRLGDADTPPVPFGNVYSYVDGSCSYSTGVPYFYGTYMDQTFADTTENDVVALTLSEASLSSVCTDRDILSSCALDNKYGDPENPVCGRLTLTGKFEALKVNSTEYDFAKEAIFERHPSMMLWPENHSWTIAKINIQDIWLLDFYGGATIIEVNDYFASTPTPNISKYGEKARKLSQLLTLQTMRR